MLQASRLGIKSAAEGVETQEDFELLKTLGCEIALVIFIAPPLGNQAFQSFITSTPTQPVEPIRFAVSPPRRGA